MQVELKCQRNQPLKVSDLHQPLGHFLWQDPQRALLLEALQIAYDPTQATIQDQISAGFVATMRNHDIGLIPESLWSKPVIQAITAGWVDPGALETIFEGRFAQHHFRNGKSEQKIITFLQLMETECSIRQAEAILPLLQTLVRRGADITVQGLKVAGLSEHSLQAGRWNPEHKQSESRRAWEQATGDTCESILDIAVRQRCGELFKFLVEAGADPQRCGYYVDKTPSEGSFTIPGRSPAQALEQALACSQADGGPDAQERVDLEGMLALIRAMQARSFAQELAAEVGLDLVHRKL